MTVLKVIGAALPRTAGVDGVLEGSEGHENPPVLGGAAVGWAGGLGLGAATITGLTGSIASKFEIVLDILGSSEVSGDATGV